jgi:hypothetical protein
VRRAALAPSVRNCRIVTVRLEAGPDKGKLTSFRFGDSGGAATPGIGDTLLVYRNPLRPGVRLVGEKITAYQFVDFLRRSPLLWLPQGVGTACARCWAWLQGSPRLCSSLPLVAEDFSPN